MSARIDATSREMLEIIMSLSREIRCCSRDETICQGVTFHQFMILDAVEKKGELGLAELHGILSVEKSTTTRLVNPLIQKGLLKRATATHDSRAAMLRLTDEGRDTHRRVWACLAGFFQSIVRHLPGGNRQIVVESVTAFAEAMRKASAEYRCCQ